jgi:hypothetical protein
MHEFDSVLACVFVLHKFEISFYLILPLDLIGHVMWKKGSLHSTWSNTHPKINKSSFGNYFVAFSPRKI